MENSKLELKVSIDPTNAAHMEAAIGLLTVLKNGENAEESTTENKEVKKKTTKRTKAKTTKAESETPTEDAKNTEAAIEAKKETAKKTETKKEDPKKENSGLLVELRELVTAKAKDHRDAIKGQLSSYGAPNLTNLNADHYEDFRDFLKDLK